MKLKNFLPYVYGYREREINVIMNKFKQYSITLLNKDFLCYPTLNPLVEFHLSLSSSQSIKSFKIITWFGSRNYVEESSCLFGNWLKQSLLKQKKILMT